MSENPEYDTAVRQIDRLEFNTERLRTALENCKAYASAEIERLRAVNAELLAALESIKRFGSLGCVDVSGHFYTGGKKPATMDVWQFPRHMLVEIDAAIAKAKP